MEKKKGLKLSLTTQILIGTVGGMLIGVLVFELLKVVLQFLGVNPYYNNIVQGLVIVVAVAVDIRKYVKKK